MSRDVMDLFKYSQDFARLKQFYFVAKEGSLTKAANKLNLDHSSLSKSMTLLAQRIKTKLLKRGAGGLKLTPDGERLFEHVGKLLHENEEFMKHFHNKEDEVRGEITIITTPAVAEIELTAVLKPFLERYPDLRISISTSRDDFDLQDHDVAIRTLISYRQNLDQLHLITHHHRLWASSDYIDRFGMPRTPQDLDNHRLLSFKPRKGNNYIDSYNWINWSLHVGNNSDSPREPFYQITSNEALHHAACLGYGIAQLPKEWVKIKNSPLIHILPSLEEPKVELYFICEKQKMKTNRIKALYDYLQTLLNEESQS